MILRNLKIKTKLLIAFSGVILFVVIVAGVGVVQVNHINQSISALYYQDIKTLETLENVKSDFSELRRLVAINVVRSAEGEPEKTEAACQNVQKQLALAKSSFQAHMDRLVEVGAPQSRLDSTSGIIKSLNEQYGPTVEGILAAARAGDSARAIMEMEKMMIVGSEIVKTVNTSFSSNMSSAAEKSADIQTLSKSAMLVMIIASVMAVLLSILLALYMGRMLSRPIITLGKAAKDIANGNLDMNLSSDGKDELGELTRDLADVAGSMRNITDALNKMAREFEKGDIEARIETADLQGVYKEVAEGVNSMISVVISEILMFLESMNKVSDGNFNIDFPKLPGKKIVMNTTIDSVQGNLKAVSKEINDLVGAAAAGRLSVRASADKYTGGWAEIMESLNRLMEAVAAPIQEAKNVLEQVAQGNFTRRVTGDYQGEFLIIENSINDMASNVASYIDEISGVLGALSKNDLTQEIVREYVGKFSEIKDAINNITNKLNRVISEISAAADQVAAGAKQISESSMTLAQGATEQASAVEELSATVLVINESTSQNAENAKDAQSLSSRSKDSAAKGDEDMDSMLTSMSGIKESSNSISKIIKVIDDIAFQTNLLALNAAVEAARAGAHGKGFAVVAEEVRNLAGRSQNAAKETAELIEESINRVDEGTKMAGTTAQALQTIVGSVSKVADIIANITAASEEQAAAISQVKEGLSQITEVVQSNSATSEEAASSSQELASQAEMLQNLVRTFQLRKEKREALYYTDSRKYR